jgi:KDO2-lipid IV(A) lauroyltransferase
MGRSNGSHTSRDRLRKRLERTAGSLALRVVVTPLRALPWRRARAVGRGMGELIFRFPTRFRRAALKNLQLVYASQVSELDRHRMARDVFRNFGETFAEFIKLPNLDREAVDQLATVEGEEHLRAALAVGKGVLMVTGHFGNWEFLGRWLALHGYKLNVVTHETRNPQVTRLMTDTRAGNGAQVLFRGSSARSVLKALKSNQIVGLLPDQNAADVFVPFLGVRTGTVDGPAIVHLKTRAPIVFAWCSRSDHAGSSRLGLGFDIKFEPADCVDPSGDRAVDIARVMTEVNAKLESQVRRHPTQWLWLHDRWKATPEVFAAVGALSPHAGASSGGDAGASHAVGTRGQLE